MLTMGQLHALAKTAGYEGYDREVVLRHLQSFAEAVWPMGHLDQIAQECARHFDEGADCGDAQDEEAAMRAEWEGEPRVDQMPDPDREAELASARAREQDAERGYHQNGYHRDEF
jgi:hypothetical protein